MLSSPSIMAKNDVKILPKYDLFNDGIIFENKIVMQYFQTDYSR